MESDLTAIKERNRERLLGLPNVVGVGIGPKTVAGKPTGVLAIKVYARTKVPDEELAENDRIPKQIEGVLTDVEQQAPLRAY